MGGFYVTSQNETLTTILGSCIAACIRDRESGIGGMNHFMLPTYSMKESSHWEHSSANASTRYGLYAMESLINSILDKGGKRNNLEFKLFGGSNILGSFASIGPLNVRFIREYMKTEGYGAAAESLGGVSPIVVNYYPRTGTAKIKRLDEKADEVISDEKLYLHKLEEQDISGDIELFE
jgi:chemotaxis protein CheD